jgi:hypothetical protein
MLRKAQAPADQESLRNVEHRIVRTGYSEVEIPVVSEASGCRQTPARFGKQPLLIRIHKATPSARMF